MDRVTLAEFEQKSASSRSEYLRKRAVDIGNVYVLLKVQLLKGLRRNADGSSEKVSWVGTALGGAFVFK